jgi:hypothetical protein
MIQWSRVRITQPLAQVKVAKSLICRYWLLASIFYRRKNEMSLLHFYSIQKRYQNSEDIIRCFALDVDAVDLNDLVAT